MSKYKVGDHVVITDSGESDGYVRGMNLAGKLAKVVRIYTADKYDYEVVPDESSSIDDWDAHALMESELELIDE